MECRIELWRDGRLLAIAGNDEHARQLAHLFRPEPVFYAYRAHYERPPDNISYHPVTIG